MEYQSLYRRFRPGRFADIKGQDHVVRALRNAVRENRVGHAYLLSGPRGTGKTTTARVLAKVLNCENPVDGEPCCECASCKAIEAGTSFDLHELDAASHNKVDDIRDLLGKVHLGTPGRTKVYLLDEVHMLTAGAENALLKTLEEPPGHVVFVLATTEPHKVVPTVRSRTQHLELSLMPAEVMTEHVRWVVEQASLDVDDDAIAHVVRAGGGSARDTLSALDQVVAAGGVARPDTSSGDLVDAIAGSDVAQALAAVSAAITRGTDPRTVGEQLIRSLRDVFLVAMGADVSHLAPADRERASIVAARLRPAAVTRALEVVGSALVDMRQSPDPRIDLEVALVRVTRPDTDASVSGLADRVARLEHALAGGVAPAAPGPGTGPATVPPATVPPTTGRGAPPEVPAAASTATTGARPSESARNQLSSRPGRRDPVRPVAATGASDAPPVIASRARPSEPRNPDPADVAQADAAPLADPSAPASPASPAAAPAPAVAPGRVPSRDEATERWPAILARLSKRASLRIAGGQLGESTATGVVYVLPHEGHRRRCEEVLDELTAAVRAELGDDFTVLLAVDATVVLPGVASPRSRAADPVEPAADEAIDLDDLVDASHHDGTTLDRLIKTFPGAELITDD